MELSENAEEFLETLWIQTQEEGKSGIRENEVPDTDKATVSQLIETGYVSKIDEEVVPTRTGKDEGRRVVRRHRLAERLLTDILSTHDTSMHDKACKFEHVLDRDLDENICTLLGHPKVCPHGKNIPPGRCCRDKSRMPQSIIQPLTQIKPDQHGKIAYVHAPHSSQLQKLMSMGVLPGAPIRLIQRYPSYVFELTGTQFAVDEEIADSIYVRAISNKPIESDRVQSPSHMQPRWRHRLRRRKRNEPP